MDSKAKGFTYGIALLVVFIWSVTFLSTKYLLGYLSPSEILFWRCVVAYLIFLAIDREYFIPRSFRDEGLFVLLGVLGTTAYFLCENFALYYSTASNVVLLLATAPMMTGIAVYFFDKHGERITKNFVWGCFFGLAGIFLVVFNGRFVLELNPMGDILAVSGSVIYAIYSVLLRNTSREFSILVITRKSFFYALLSLSPLWFTPMINWTPRAFESAVVLAHLLFLGIVASAFCYYAWNKVIWALGAAKANNFIYLVPPMTMIFAAIIFRERITLFAIAGGAMILIGVYIAQREEKI